MPFGDMCRVFSVAVGTLSRSNVSPSSSRVVNSISQLVIANIARISLLLFFEYNISTFMNFLM